MSAQRSKVAGARRAALGVVRVERLDVVAVAVASGPGAVGVDARAVAELDLEPVGGARSVVVDRVAVVRLGTVLALAEREEGLHDQPDVVATAPLPDQLVEQRPAVDVEADGVDAREPGVGQLVGQQDGALRGPSCGWARSWHWPNVRRGCTTSRTSSRPHHCRTSWSSSGRPSTSKPTGSTPASPASVSW